MKWCSKCGTEKELGEFYKDNGTKDKLSRRCKKCKSEDGKLSYERNKEKILKRQREYYQENKEKVLEKNKSWYQNNKERHKDLVKRWNEEHLGFMEEYREQNREKHRKYCSLYYQENRDRVNKQKLEWDRKKMKEDVAYRLRSYISRSITSCLKNNGGTKKNKTFLKYLPYTINELKEHLESQFEPWMTWKNHGVYRLDGPKVWHIDHIIPKTLFYYETMNCEEFRKCWALENLRPLEALENMKKGNKMLENEGEK